MKRIRIWIAREDRPEYRELEETRLYTKKPRRYTDEAEQPPATKWHDETTGSYCTADLSKAQARRLGVKRGQCRTGVIELKET